MREILRWSGVGLSAMSVIFAACGYFGFWGKIRGDDLLTSLANRIDTSYVEVSRQVNPTDPEWSPLMRVINKYSNAKLPNDRQPTLFARLTAVASAKTTAGEWTAPTTPILLLYREWPAQDTAQLGQDAFVVGTLGDFRDWIKRDKDDFDFFWRTLILGMLSVCVGVFLAMPDKQNK